MAVILAFPKGTASNKRITDVAGLCKLQPSSLIVCADSVTRGLVRDHPSMNMKIGTLVPGYVLSANLSL